MTEQVTALFECVKLGKCEQLGTDPSEFCRWKQPLTLSFETENEETVDVTELKHYLHRANIHRTNPSLFKRLSDVSKKSDFTERWTLEQTIGFFTQS